MSGLVGFAGATGGNSSEATARMFIQLKDFDQRPPIERVMARLRPQVAKVIGAKFYMQAGQDVTVGGRLEQAEYQYTLTDTDSDELNKWAPVYLAKMQQMGFITDVASDQQIASPHISIEVDRDAASRLGISLTTIDATLYSAFGQQQIATIYLPAQQSKLILEVQPKFQSEPIGALGHLSHRQQRPGTLSAVAHYATTVQPLTINHQGVFSAVTLSFNLAPGAALSQAVDAITSLGAQIHAPDTLLGTFQGTAQAFQSSLSSTPLLVLAAVLSFMPCSACCMKASFIRSRSCRRCLRPASARF